MNNQQTKLALARIHQIAEQGMTGRLSPDYAFEEIVRTALDMMPPHLMDNVASAIAAFKAADEEPSE